MVSNLVSGVGIGAHSASAAARIPFRAMALLFRARLSRHIGRQHLERLAARQARKLNQVDLTLRQNPVGARS